MDIPNIEEIKDMHFWVPPHPLNLMLTAITHNGKEVNINILAVDLDVDLPDENIPRRIYVDQQLITLQSQEETKVLSLLSDLITHEMLGHKESLAVHMARELIAYFNTENTE